MQTVRMDLIPLLPAANKSDEYKRRLPEVNLRLDCQFPNSFEFNCAELDGTFVMFT